MLTLASFELTVGQVDRLPLGFMLSLVGAWYVSVDVVSVAGPLEVAGGLVPVDCMGSVGVMRLVLRLRSSLSTPHWLQFSSFIGVLSLSLMFSRVSGSTVPLRQGGMRCRSIGQRCVVRALVGQCVPGALGLLDSPRLAWLLQVGF